MKLFCSSCNTAPPTLALLLSIGLTMPVQAAAPQVAGPIDSVCQATSVSDANEVFGYCTSGNAWLSKDSTTFTDLPPLANGQPCTSGLLGNQLLTGTCNRASGEQVPVTWSVSNPSTLPVELKALAVSGTLALDSIAKAITANPKGYVVGNSVKANGVQTAVIWPPQQQGNAERVSAADDNCDAVSVNDAPSNDRPTVALNCPDSQGNPSASVAVYKNNTYVLGELKRPQDAVYCTVKAVNINNQLAGTCYYKALPATATFWPSVSALPRTLESTDKLATEAVFLNNNGVSVVYVLAPNKTKLPIVWDGVGNRSMPVPLPDGFQLCTANAFASASERLFMTCFANDLNVPVQAFSWTSTGAIPVAAQSPVPVPVSGQVSGQVVIPPAFQPPVAIPLPALTATGDNRATAISSQGTFGAGYAKVAPGKIRAFSARLR